jgi:Spy/CpxP family protein refolding chaperone
MQRSKYLALLLLLGTATASYAAGFTSERVMGRDRMRECGRSGDQRPMRTRLGEELALTADQRASLDRILDERHRQMSVLLAPLRPQMDSVSEATRTQIRVMLAPAQQTKFDRLHQETVAKRNAERR